MWLARKFILLSGWMTIIVASPVEAQNEPQPPKKVANPNQIVCEKSEVLGSRVAVKKVCMTRAEWADRRLQDRQEIDRVQMTRGAKGE